MTILDHQYPSRIDPGREPVRALFRERGYDGMSDRSRMLVDMTQKALTLYLGRPVSRAEILGGIADVGGDMQGAETP